MDKKMRIIDMHCDTLMAAYFHAGPDADLFSCPYAMTDFQRMRQNEALAQFFAIFVVPQALYPIFGARPVPDEVYIDACARIFERSVAAHSDVIARAGSMDDLLNNRSAGKMSAILTMEDGAPVQGKLENLDRYYNMGIRALGLTWNHKNCFGSPNSSDAAVMAEGLTDFGKEAVLHMQEIGMLVDVSHLSDGGFWDVARLAKKPFVATHSNCRALCPHPRNMTDDMIRALAESGGVMGLNFGPEFLSPAGTDIVSSVERIVAMAKHEKAVGGIGVVAVGTDFDGIHGTLEIAGCDGMHLLTDGLSRGGFTDDEIDRILCQNVMRVLKESLGESDDFDAK